jgi:hypothetical protein
METFAFHERTLAKGVMGGLVGEATKRSPKGGRDW